MKTYKNLKYSSIFTVLELILDESLIPNNIHISRNKVHTEMRSKIIDITVKFW